MIKKITMMLGLTVLLTSCASTVVNTMMNINTGEARRFAKTVLNDEEMDIRKFPVSSDFESYLKSEEGKQFFENIRGTLGDLESLKLRGIKGSSTDTMNYRFVAAFKTSDKKQEVRVQTLNDSYFAAVKILPWQDVMKP